MERFVEALRNSEVDQSHEILLEGRVSNNHVVWFEISMDEVCFVNVRKRIAKLQEDCHRAIYWQSVLAVEDLSQVRTFDIFHDVVGATVVKDSEVVDFDDIRMIESAGKLGFSLKTFESSILRFDLLIENLDCDRFLHLAVETEKDGTENTATDLGTDFISVRDYFSDYRARGSFVHTR